MILVDHREGSRELLPHLTRLGVEAELTSLEFGDVAFEGHGPTGNILIGVERKRLHDMLACIDDARYTGHQRVGMAQLYQSCFLLIEGIWRPHDPTGLLLESANGEKWYDARYRSTRVMYAKLRRYLFSVSLSGVHVLYTRDIQHTARDLVEAFHYFQKPWHKHQSLLAIQRLAIPTLQHKPSLVRKWAADVDDIGITLSERAERLFRTPIALANADEQAWMSLPGVGVRMAQKIYKQIRGIK